MNAYSTLLLISFLCGDLSYGFTTVFTPGNTPLQSYQRGSVYGLNNPYNKQNTQNPYSVYRSPYNVKSVYQNSARYGTRIFNPQGIPVGTISRQFGYGNKTTITIPYNRGGNQYQQQQITQPYNLNRNNHPYNQFNYIYNPKSVYNNPNYATKLVTAQGKNGGVIQFKTYNNQNSVYSSYSNYGNSYENSIVNPYTAPNR